MHLMPIKTVQVGDSYAVISRDDRYCNQYFFRLYNVDAGNRHYYTDYIGPFSSVAEAEKSARAWVKMLGQQHQLLQQLECPNGDRERAGESEREPAPIEEMTVFRVFGGKIFGRSQQQLAVDDVVKEVFATPDPMMVGRMLGWEDSMAFAEDGGLSWASVAVIQPERVRQPRPDEKIGHDAAVDEGEVIVVSGRVVEILSPGKFLSRYPAGQQGYDESVTFACLKRR